MNALLELFDELCECSPDTRAARLSEIALTDAALAERLRAMLKADATGTELIAHDIEAQASVPADAWRKADRNAYAFGAYRIVRELGAGGMGTVWLAQRTLGSTGVGSTESGAGVQQVAIKFMHRSGNAQLLKQFERERDALARLEHPNIARLIDAGLTPDGEPYIACEFVDGTPLVEFVRAQKLDLSARLQLIEALCEAVDYAHRRLLVHRDIKPSNVMVDIAGRVRLLDFGIAKALDTGASEQTRSNPLSPAYAAPEQAMGQPISTATDIFGLGLLLFELLTGQLPAQRRVLTAGDMAHKISQETIEAPSLASAADIKAIDPIIATREWAKRLHGDLDLIVLKALKREPERRYASALVLADDLRRFREGRTIAARPDTTWYRLGKLVARNRLAVASASAMLLALIVGFGVALWQANVARAQAQIAGVQTQLAEHAAKASAESADRTRRVKEFMMQTFVGADPMRRPEGAPQTVTAAFEEALKRIDSEVADDPKLQVDLLDDFGEVLANQGRFEESKTLLDRAFILAEKTYPKDSPVIAETLANLFAVASATGRQVDAAQQIERAFAILEPRAREFPGQFSNVLSSMVVLRGTQGRVDESLAFAKRGLAITRLHAVPGTDMLTAALSNYAMGLLQAGRIDEAEPYAREAVLEAEKIGGPNSPMMGNVLTGLSAIIYRQGKIAESVQINERRLKIMRAVYPGVHPSTAEALTDIGWQSDAGGDVAHARASLDEAIGMFAALQSWRLLIPLRHRALLEVGQKNYPAALSDFDRALAQCKRDASEHVQCTVIRSNRAGLLARMGRGAEALQEVEVTIADLAQRKMLDRSEYAQALESKALALRALGRQQDALSTQFEAITLYGKVYGAQHEEVNHAKHNLALLQMPQEAQGALVPE